LVPCPNERAEIELVIVAHPYKYFRGTYTAALNSNKKAAETQCQVSGAV
jgi:hypothetical protein